MNPHAPFCHTPACSARGKVGLGNIGVHSQKERRYRCTLCGDTFVATKDTAFYRLQTSSDWVALVLTLLSLGCPLQAIVVAFGFDERTVARWQRAAGQHCQRLHEEGTTKRPVDLQHVQADEIWVKAVGRRFWMGMAIAVPFRLWLGGVIGERRDCAFLRALVSLIRRAARHPAILICVDGLAGYVSGVRHVFRRALYTGKRGRPRREAEPGWLMGQVVKQSAKRRVVSVTQRIVEGSAEAIAAVLSATRGGTQINTAFIERLNGTFRAALAPMVRRGRALARTEATLEAGMYLVGCAYNFCWYHRSLRLPAPKGSESKWIERTPAMAAGLTARPWRMIDLLGYPIARPAKPPGRRRRPPRSVEPCDVLLAA
jgi:transposase-like protein